MALEVDQAGFEALLEKGLPVVVDFSATWCGPCQALAPTLEELAETYKGKISVCKIDVDAVPELTRKFGVRNIPAVFFLKNGEVVDKNIGNAAKSVLDAKFQALLA